MQDLALIAETDLPTEGGTTIQTWNYCGSIIQVIVAGDHEVIVHEGVHYANPVWVGNVMPKGLLRFAELLANDCYEDLR